MKSVNLRYCIPLRKSQRSFAAVQGMIKLVFPPLFSLFILILGNGLLTTLLTLRLHVENAPSIVIGLMSSAYYAGLACGSFRVEKFIVRVGHIRAFSVFASAVAVTSLLHGMFVSVWPWLMLRALNGFFTGGLFVVIESWMLISGVAKMRGQLLALYMITLYAGQALGQFFINFGSIESLFQFSIVSMLSSLAVIPLAMTKVGQPQISEPSVLNFKVLFRVSPSGVIGCFSGGMMLGAIYGLLPLFVKEQTGSTVDTSLFMSLVILGGMALQYPIGKLSDYVERRKVLIGIALLSVLVSLLIMLIFQIAWVAALLIFLFGGLVFTVYPLSITHACDNLETKDILCGTQGLLLAYGIGATIGPFIAPIFMNYFGPSGLFIYFIVINSFLLVFFLLRRLQVGVVTQEEQFVSLPQTTPITATFDPRTRNKYNDNPKSKY